ncbi:hypothetical protein [Clostridium sp. JNZ J1-5]
MEVENVNEKDQEQELEGDKSLLLGMLGEANVEGEDYYKSTPIVTNYYYGRD